jgi:hypothetical protein
VIATSIRTCVGPPTTTSCHLRAELVQIEVAGPEKPHLFPKGENHVDGRAPLRRTDRVDDLGEPRLVVRGQDCRSGGTDDTVLYDRLDPYPRLDGVGVCAERDGVGTRFEPVHTGD